MVTLQSSLTRQESQPDSHPDVPSPSQLRILETAPQDTEVSIHDLQSYLVPVREGVWNKNYGQALKQDPPSSESVFGRCYALSAKFHDPTTSLQRYIQDYVTNISPEPQTTGTSHKSQLGGFASKKMPTDIEVEGLARRLETEICARLDK